MNRQDLVKAIAEKAGMTQVSAKSALEATIACIQAELAKGGEVKLVGFGSFKVADRAARKGRNPKTGEAIDIPAKTVVRFKAGSNLAAEANGEELKPKAPRKKAAPKAKAAKAEKAEVAA